MNIHAYIVYLVQIKKNHIDVKLPVIALNIKKFLEQMIVRLCSVKPTAEPCSSKGRTEYISSILSRKISCSPART